MLHGYEAVATRLMQTIAAASSAERVSRHLASRLARDAETLPEIDRQVRRRFPDEPYRQRFGFIAERLRRTRAALTGEAAPLTGRYDTPDELDAELDELQQALVADGLDRVAWGDVADLRWQLGHVRVPPRVARDTPARDGPSGGAGGDPAGATANGPEPRPRSRRAFPWTR